MLLSAREKWSAYFQLPQFASVHNYQIEPQTIKWQTGKLWQLVAIHHFIFAIKLYLCKPTLKSQLWIKYYFKSYDATRYVENVSLQVIMMPSDNVI